jgi:hypothetical protein
MHWYDIVQLILGEAEQIIPIFVHNPKSQQVEAVIMTTANNGINTLAAKAQANAASAASGASTNAASPSEAAPETPVAAQ